MNTEERTQEKKMPNRILPIVLLALNLTFFFYLIPEHIAEEYSITFTIVGGVLTVIFSAWVCIASIPKIFDKFPIVMGLSCISSLFIFGYFFLGKTVSFSSNELKENGVYTEAVVIDKTIMYGKRGHRSYSMEVRFVTNENKAINADILINDKEYYSFYEGIKIPIMYSSKHPNIARIPYNIKVN